MNKCAQKTEIPEWMTQGKTTLIQRDLITGTAPTNYRPITCLPMIRKILTAQIREKIYYSLISFLDEQKEATRELEGQRTYYIQINTFSTKVKREEKNVAMACIDHKKAYDMVPKGGYYTVSKCIKYPTKSYC